MRRKKTPFSIPRDLWRIPLTAGWVKINCIVIEKNEAVSTNYQYLLYPMEREGKWPVIRNEEELTNFLDKNLEAPHVREELIRNCFPYDPVPRMLEELRSKYER